MMTLPCLSTALVSAFTSFLRGHPRPPNKGKDSKEDGSQEGGEEWYPRKAAGLLFGVASGWAGASTSLARPVGNLAPVSSDTTHYIEQTSSLAGHGFSSNSGGKHLTQTSPVVPSLPSSRGGRVQTIPALGPPSLNDLPTCLHLTVGLAPLAAASKRSI